MSPAVPQPINICVEKLADRLDDVNPSSRDASALLQSLMVLSSDPSRTR